VAVRSASVGPGIQHDCAIPKHSLDTLTSGTFCKRWSFTGTTAARGNCWCFTMASNQQRDCGSRGCLCYKFFLWGKKFYALVPQSASRTAPPIRRLLVIFVLISMHILPCCVFSFFSRSRQPARDSRNLLALYSRKYSSDSAREHASCARACNFKNRKKKKGNSLTEHLKHNTNTLVN
jgi:hypothetical protein